MHASRRTVRYIAAALAATMATIYLLIGVGVLDVGGSASDRESLWVFGALAGGAFLLGAVLLLTVDRRWIWILGAVFQVFVYWAYIDVSSIRTPPYEVWGVTLRIIQLPLLVALTYLAIRPPEPAHAPRVDPDQAGHPSPSH